MEFEQLFDEKRDVDSRYHVSLAIKWKDYGQDKELHTPMVYSAFEFRCAIERIILEFYILMRDPDDFDPEAEETTIHRFGKLTKAIFLKFGNKGKLNRAVQFNCIYNNDVFQSPFNLAFVDVAKMQSYWSKLSEFCHRQLEPGDTWYSEEWVSEGYILLNEFEDYLRKYFGGNTHTGWIREESLPAPVVPLRKDFIEGKINEQSLKTRLGLIKPVIEERTKIEKGSRFV